MTTEKPPASLLCNQDPLARPHPALDHNPLAYDPPSTPSPAPSLRPFHTPYVINAAVHFLLLLVSGLFSPVAPRWLVVSKGFAQIFLNNENATIPRFIFFFGTFSKYPHNKAPLHLFFTVDWRFLAMEWGLIIASFCFVWYLLRLRHT